MHVIRLRKPWIRTLGDDGIECRVDVPDETCLETQATEWVACYHRRFNCPSRLQDVRVYLRITGWQGQMTSLCLNAVPIPVNETCHAIDVEVTALLRSHNELVITLSGTNQLTPRLSGEVSLGIDDRSLS